MSSSYRIKLSFDGGSQVLSVEPSMTLHELGEKAKEILLENTNSNKDVIVRLSTKTSAGPPSNLDWESNSALVRDVIPKMSLVQCHATATETSSKDNVDSPKKTAKAINAPVVDLMSDDDDDDDDNDDDEQDKNLKNMEPPKKKAKAINADVVDLMSSDDEEVVEVKALNSEQRPVKRKRVDSPPLDDPRDPTTVTKEGDYWIWQPGPKPFRDEPVLGKWLLFRSQDRIANDWNQIAAAVQSGNLQAANSKVATQYNSASSNNKSYVICIYTSKERMMQVGNILIEMVQHDIRYKTDEATALGRYANPGGSQVTEDALYWNHGKPSTTRLLWTKAQSLKRARKAKAADEKLEEPFQNATVTVKGLQHSLYKNNNKFQWSPLAPVQLVREPQNEHDNNAIRVELVPTSTNDNQNHSAKLLALQNQRAKVGYLAKEQAQVLAPWLDRDLVQIAGATIMSTQGWESATVSLRGKATAEDAKEMLSACFRAN